MRTPSGQDTRAWGNKPLMVTARSAELTTVAAEKTALSVEELVKATKKTVQDSADSAEASSRSAKHSLWLTLIAVFLAGGSLLYAYKDDRGDEEWQVEQLRILNEIRNISKSQSQHSRMEMMR